MSNIIQNIKLNNVASYKESTEIKGLKKLNFFFGSNGAGKSTIGKYLQTLSKAKNKEEVEGFELCSIDGYNPEQHEILVFNQKFINDNFINRNDIPGIFTLDERNKEAEEEIEKEQIRINKWNECVAKLKEENTSINTRKTLIYSGVNGVVEKCWGLRNDFNKNFIKMPTLEHPKRKENHYNKIISILQKKDEQEIDYEELKSDYEKLYEEEIVKIEQSLKIATYKKIRRLESEINDKLNIPFTGNKDVDIANMIETLGIQKWVEERYNQLNKSKILQKCPFCQEETINQNLVQQFQDYFDRTYTEKKEALQNLKTQYNNLTKDFILNLKSITPNYPLKSEFNQLINKLERFFEKQEKVIQNKIDNTNEELSITSLNSHIQELKIVVNTITANNENVEKLDEKQQNLIKNIWEYMAFHAKEFVNEYEKEEERLNKRLEKVKAIKAYRENKIRESELKIEEKREETANTETARKEINDILKNTGFNGFEIEKRETTENNISRYYLKRPDENKEDVFSSLSEGEKNFIAFLYFYWLCKGTDDQENKKGNKKIIVIDDPVSSLDSQALFVVITIIRGLAHKKGKRENNKFFSNENIAQLLILTHNLFFQKEVCFNYKEFLCNDLHYYLVSKHSGQSTVSEPSVKELIKNDYELLWKSLAQVKDDENLIVVIGNIMRRILQTYLQFTKKEPREAKILEGFSKHSNRYIIYRAFMSQNNEQSHEIQIMNEFFYQSLNDTKAEDLLMVFKNIFNDIGSEHYKIMNELYSIN